MALRKQNAELRAAPQITEIKLMPTTSMKVEAITEELIRRNEKLEAVAKAAKNFADEIPCYSQGMSLVSEDIRGEYAQLIEALAALDDHIVDSNEMVPKGEA